MSAFIQFKDVKKTYKVGDVEIHASNGVNFEEIGRASCRERV